MQDKPFVTKQDDGTYEGLAIDIYNKVLVELLKDGIDLKLQFKDLDTYGSKLGDGSWTGVFGAMLDTVSVV